MSSSVKARRLSRLSPAYWPTLEEQLEFDIRHGEIVSSLRATVSGRSAYNGLGSFVSLYRSRVSSCLEPGCENKTYGLERCEKHRPVCMPIPKPPKPTKPTKPEIPAKVVRIHDVSKQPYFKAPQGPVILTGQSCMNLLGALDVKAPVDSNGIMWVPVENGRSGAASGSVLIVLSGDRLIAGMRDDVKIKPVFTRRPDAWYLTKLRVFYPEDE